MLVIYYYYSLLYIGEEPSIRDVGNACLKLGLQCLVEVYNFTFSLYNRINDIQRGGGFLVVAVFVFIILMEVLAILVLIPVLFVLIFNY